MNFPKGRIIAISLVLEFAVLLPLGLVVWQRAPVTDTKSWELLMLLGFVAAGGLALLPVLTGRWARVLRRSVSTVRAGYRLHDVFGYLVAGLVLAHGIGALIAEPTTLGVLEVERPAVHAFRVG